MCGTPYRRVPSQTSPEYEQERWLSHVPCAPFVLRKAELATDLSRDVIAPLACVRLTGWPVAWNWRRAVLSADAGLLVVFCDFGLKTPIHALFEGFFGHISPQNVTPRPKPKRTVLGRNHVIWAIKHEYRPRGSSWRVKKKKGQYRTGHEKSHKRVIFHLFGEKPPLKRSTSKIV